MIIYFIYSRKIHLFQLSVFTDVNIGKCFSRKLFLLIFKFICMKAN